MREEKYFRLLDAAVTAGRRRSEHMEAAEMTQSAAGLDAECQGGERPYGLTGFMKAEVEISEGRFFFFFLCCAFHCFLWLRVAACGLSSCDT